jgi:hypothetical protein
MARPSVVVVCTNVAQAGRIAQGLGTNHGREGAVHHQDLGGGHTTTTTRGDRAQRSTEGRGPTSARSATAVRMWKVFDGKTLHEVKDLGTRLEARSEEDGAVVWTGVRIPSGWYETRSTTLPELKRAGFLQKVHDGDQATPGRREAPASTPRSAPVSGPRAVKRPAAAKARKAATKPPAEAPRALQSVVAPKKRGRPKKAKPTASAPPKSKAPMSAKPKSKAPVSAKPKSKAPTSAARPKPKPSPKVTTKATAKRKPATKATTSGPATSRSPASTQISPASMRRQLHAKDPETPEAALATLEDIWRGGASEPTRAWMIAKGFTDLADAFVDWVEHHTIEANDYMQAARALRSA